jgi:UDP-3-O-[3-hydroxymyristoyl] glucosamine N-acyltransferase
LFYPNVTVREHSQIGDRVILQPGCVIGSDGYGYELVDGKHTKVDQVGIVVLEDDVEIGANTAIDRARFGKTIIGEGTKVDNLVQIAHNVQTEKHCLIVSQSGLAGSSKLGNYVTVAAQAGVGGHIKIGDEAILAGRAGATKSLAGGAIYSGFPARPMREESRKQGSLSKLPQLIKDVRKIKQQLEEKES